MRKSEIVTRCQFRRTMATSVSAKLQALVHGHQGLAVIAAAKEEIQRVGRVRETPDHVLLVMQLSREHHRGEGPLSFGETLLVVKDEDAFHAGTTRDEG